MIHNLSSLSVFIITESNTTAIVYIFYYGVSWNKFLRYTLPYTSYGEQKNRNRKLKKIEKDFLIDEK